MNTDTQKQLRHRVTPFLAQRILTSGNSYFWRTAGGAFGTANNSASVASKATLRLGGTITVPKPLSLAADNTF